MAVFWDVAQRSLVDWRFGRVYCLRVMNKAVNSSETSASIDQTTRCNTSEDGHLYIWVKLTVIKNHFKEESIIHYPSARSYISCLAAFTNLMHTSYK
jgi:hypothetical protein